jgi:flagellar protein FlaG
MTAQSTSALGSLGMARATAMPPPTGSAGAERAAGAAAVAPAEAVARPAPAVPRKAELTIDPQARAQDLREAIARLNEQMRSNGRALAFSIDEALNRTVITVTNSETGHVVRQIPDEALLRVAHNLDRVSGLLNDERI